MTTNDWITKLEAKIFDADMEAAIRSAYDGLAKNGGIYEKTEQACAASEQTLSGTLSKEQTDKIARYRQCAAAQMHCVSKYGFIAGLINAIFCYCDTANKIPINGEALMEQQISVDQSVEVRAAVKELTDECLTVDAGLQQELPGDLYEHVVSITCAWDERIHFSGIYGYYLGYRTALSLLQTLFPTAPVVMEPLTLILEHHMGLNRTFEESKGKARSK